MEGYNSQAMIGPYMDPSRNNLPLQFKGQMQGYGEGSQDNNYGGEMELEGWNNEGDMRNTYNASGDNSVTGPLLPTPWDMNSMMNPMMNMMGQMGQMDPWSQTLIQSANQQIMMEMMPKQVITLPSCVLYPPPPNAAPPTTRERPPGCRTIFVGGLPETTTEDILREVFQSCGEMCSIRLSKKNFAHIRFIWHESVDRALMISGYRMKIENKDDKANTGRIHIDFAQARDDQYEFECHQRAMMREMRHRQRMEEDQMRPPSPPQVVHYSDHEAVTLLDEIKGVDTFSLSAETLMVWLERGDCNRRNSHHFYSLLQSVHAHLKRVQSEKSQAKQEQDVMKQQLAQRMNTIVHQVEQIDRVFGAATKQKAWDHFTKAQRKNLETWRKQCAEQRALEEAEMVSERRDDEMEMSDSEDTAEPAAKKKKDSPSDELLKLQEENDALKCQLEAYKNETEILRLEVREAQAGALTQAQTLTSPADVAAEDQDAPEAASTSPGEEKDKEEEKVETEEKVEDSRDKQVKLLQTALQGMQQQLLSMKKEQKQKEDQLNQSIAELKKGQEEQIAELQEQREEAERELRLNSFSEKEIKVLGVLSAFLNVHPKGASIDYLWSYLQQLDIEMKTSQIEDLLEKCPPLFEQTVSGSEIAVDKRWKVKEFCLKNDKEN